LEVAEHLKEEKVIKTVRDQGESTGSYGTSVKMVKAAGPTKTRSTWGKPHGGNHARGGDYRGKRGEDEVI